MSEKSYSIKRSFYFFIFVQTVLVGCWGHDLTCCEMVSRSSDRWRIAGRYCRIDPKNNLGWHLFKLTFDILSGSVPAHDFFVVLNVCIIAGITHSLRHKFCPPPFFFFFRSDKTQPSRLLFVIFGSDSQFLFYAIKPNSVPGTACRIMKGNKWHESIC